MRSQAMIHDLGPPRPDLPMTTSRPLLSIVIPTRDTRDLTLSCIQSVQALASGAEIILVDDGSRDGTSEIVAGRYPAVRILRHPEPSGFTASANEGLRAGQGQILLLLNSDTELLPGSAEALEAAFENHRRMGIAGARLRYPDGRAQWSGGPAPTLFWLFGLASGIPGLLGRLPVYRSLRPVRGAGGGDAEWVTGAAMAFRREVWERLAPLDEGFRFYGQDLDVCVRARHAGWRVAVVDDFRVLHHHGATIGTRSGSAGNHHPELLWSDLVRWASKHRGRSWARRAARSLQWGGRVRLWGRALVRARIPPSARDAWRRDSLAFRRAIAAVGALASEI